MKKFSSILFAFIVLTLQEGSEMIWVNTDQINFLKADPYARGTLVGLGTQEIIVQEKLEEIFQKLARTAKN